MRLWQMLLRSQTHLCTSFNPLFKWAICKESQKSLLSNSLLLPMKHPLSLNLPEQDIDWNYLTHTTPEAEGTLSLSLVMLQASCCQRVVISCQRPVESSLLSTSCPQPVLAWAGASCYRKIYLRQTTMASPSALYQTLIFKVLDKHIIDTLSKVDHTLIY